MISSTLPDGERNEAYRACRFVLDVVVGESQIGANIVRAIQTGNALACKRLRSSPIGIRFDFPLADTTALGTVTLPYKWTMPTKRRQDLASECLVRG